MEKIEFNVSIKAPKEKVWETLWNDKTYREWTSVFSPGSYARSDWKEGSEVFFLNAEEDGMYALIDKKIPNEQMSFRHMGEVKKGVTQPPQWGESLESYFLSEQNGVTELRAELDAPEDFVKYFKDIFPKALDKVKQLSEQ